MREQIIEALRNRDMVIETINKNGVILTGVHRRMNGAGTCATIYVEDFVEKRFPYDEFEGSDKEYVNHVVNAMIDFLEEHDAKAVQFDMKELTTPEYILSHAKVALFKDIADGITYNEWLDGLKEIVYVVVGEASNGIGSYKMTDANLAASGIDRDELFKAARRNTADAISFTDMLAMMNAFEMFGTLDSPEIEIDEDTPDGMYTLGITSHINGAGVICSPEVVDTLKLLGDVILIPSSVHEWIVLKGEQFTYSVDYIKELCEMVNSTQVLPEEKLSDTIFKLTAEGIVKIA